MTEDLLAYWEKRRPAKYKTDPIDRTRYSTIQYCLENHFNWIDEEHPRSGKSEANCMYGVAWWLSRQPNFKFGLVTPGACL